MSVMKNFFMFVFLFCAALVFFTGCSQDIPLASGTEKGFTQTNVVTSRPENVLTKINPAATEDRVVAMVNPYINARSIMRFFPAAGSSVRDSAVEYGLYVYFALPYKLLKYSLGYSIVLQNTLYYDLNFIDLAGSSWGLTGASNAYKSFYTNLMESNIALAYPSELEEVYGFSSYYTADNKLHFIVTGKIVNRVTRYIIDYLYQNGTFVRTGIAIYSVDNYLDFTSVGSTLYGANGAAYPTIWKKDSVTGSQVSEKLPNSYNCHGFYSYMTGKNEILYFDKPDFNYDATGGWGFYALSYFTNTNAVELVYMPSSGVTF